MVSQFFFPSIQLAGECRIVGIYSSTRSPSCKCKLGDGRRLGTEVVPNETFDGYSISESAPHIQGGLSIEEAEVVVRESFMGFVVNEIEAVNCFNKSINTASVERAIGELRF
jgi:hypothetical protein